MKPKVMLLADVGDRIDRIESAKDGRSRCGGDEERDLSIRDALQDKTLQLGRNHLTPTMTRLNRKALWETVMTLLLLFVARDADAIVRTKA